MYYYRKFQDGGEMADVPEQEEQEQAVSTDAGDQMSIAKIICALIGYAASKQLQLSIEDALEYAQQLYEESPEALMELQDSDELVEAGALILQEEDPEAFLQLIEQELQIAALKQVEQARRGMKLNYLKSLKGQCPMGYETVYLRRGGHICPVCQKKAARRKMQDGGDFKPGTDGRGSGVDPKIVKRNKLILKTKYGIDGTYALCAGADAITIKGKRYYMNGLGTLVKL